MKISKKKIGFSFGFIVLMISLFVVFQNFTQVSKFQEKVIRLPIIFGGGQFKDDSRRLSVASDYSAGTPGFDSLGNGYFRLGNKIIKKKIDNSYTSIDFSKELSRVLNNEIFAEKKIKWDEKWDKSAMVDDRIVFDNKDRAYTLVTPYQSNLKFAVLLYSLDKCQTWHGIPLKGNSAALEMRDGFNDLSGVPAVLSFGVDGTMGDKVSNNLWLHSFYFDANNAIRSYFENGKLIASNSLLSVNHSGGGNSVITRSGKIFVVYPGATLPEGVDSGTPNYICQVSKNLSKSNSPICKYLGVAGDINKTGMVVAPDAHHIPAITVDKDGQLTVVFGSHLGMFKMTQSEDNLNIEGDWSEPVLIGELLIKKSNGSTRYGSYTYVGLATSPKNESMIIIARTEEFSAHYQLVEMIKPHGEDFKTWADGSQQIKHRVLVEPGRSYYAAYRHRISFDKSGNFYLHFKYWPGQLTTTEAALFDLKTTDSCDISGKRCMYHDMKHLFPTTLKSTDDALTFDFYSAGI